MNANRTLEWRRGDGRAWRQRTCHESEKQPCNGTQRAMPDVDGFLLLFKRSISESRSIKKAEIALELENSGASILRKFIAKSRLPSVAMPVT